MAKGDRARQMTYTSLIRRMFANVDARLHPHFFEFPGMEPREGAAGVFSEPRKIVSFLGLRGALGFQKNVLLRPGESVRVGITRLENPGEFSAELGLRSMLARFGLDVSKNRANELVLTNRGQHVFPLWAGMELGRNLPHPKNLSPLTKKEVLRLLRKKRLVLPSGYRVRSDGRIEACVLQAKVHTSRWIESDSDLRKFFGDPLSRMWFWFMEKEYLDDQPAIKPGEFVLTAATPIKLPPKVSAIIDKNIICNVNGAKSIGPAQFSSSRGIDAGYHGPLYIEAFLPSKEKKEIRLHKIVLTLNRATHTTPVSTKPSSTKTPISHSLFPYPWRTKEEVMEHSRRPPEAWY